MNTFGLLTGFATLLIIGMGFPLVMQSERAFGYLFWPYLLGAGLILIAASTLISSNWLSAIVGILGATFAWGSTELKEQAVRAEIGWYPFRVNKIRPPFADIIRKWKTPHL